MLTFIEGMDDCFDFEAGLNPAFKSDKEYFVSIKKQAYETSLLHII
jgi:hypothetical protein